MFILKITKKASALSSFIYNNGKISVLCGKNDNSPKFVHLHKKHSRLLCTNTKIADGRRKPSAGVIWSCGLCGLYLTLCKAVPCNEEEYKEVNQNNGNGKAH